MSQTDPSSAPPPPDPRSAGALGALVAQAGALVLLGLASCSREPGEGPRVEPASEAASAPAVNARYQSRRAQYEIPGVELVTQRSEAVALRELLDDPRPVILNFIFTSCGTICPTLTATLAHAGSELQGLAPTPRLMSISIDPEHDTPSRLLKYAERFQAPEDWTFLTGRAADITSVLKAFDAYRGDRLGHLPLTFLRRRPGEPWLRLDGFTGVAGLVSEYRALASAP